ncbi:MAG TPA: hypothetical protein PLW90_06235 [Smithellaceae bacterium]|jgi:3-hydroxyacyl-[acyl-carrier-protein] dehydratase|nr:MAG: hypothetical protein BWY90_01289 [Deltaproteobacteria bacterium ADurb.BinA014]HNQ18580.1 hypothetical protein [Smithellaceae bacterium]HNT91196.1 hypothetical protein [Smithellaceae bacterium]HNV64057.1 hypothetical protein [Smithellaceae bacterium]HNZ31500.1 hypothetical protein [Smithellaceae bacterium]
MKTKLIGVRYCGGCNPTIDRVRIVSEIQKMLPGGGTLTSDTNTAPWETGIMMCGCVSTCIDKSEIRNLARRWIIVAGNNIDMLIVPEKEIAQTVVEKINSFS